MRESAQYDAYRQRADAALRATGWCSICRRPSSTAICEACAPLVRSSPKPKKPKRDVWGDGGTLWREPGWTMPPRLGTCALAVTAFFAITVTLGLLAGAFL